MQLQAVSPPLEQKPVLRRSRERSECENPEIEEKRLRRESPSREEEPFGPSTPPRQPHPQHFTRPRGQGRLDRGGHGHHLVRNGRGSPIPSGKQPLLPHPPPYGSKPQTYAPRPPVSSAHAAMPPTAALGSHAFSTAPSMQQVFFKDNFSELFLREKGNQKNNFSFSSVEIENLKLFEGRFILIFLCSLPSSQVFPL